MYIMNNIYIYNDKQPCIILLLLLLSKKTDMTFRQYAALIHREVRENADDSNLRADKLAP